MEEFIEFVYLYAIIPGILGWLVGSIIRINNERN